MEPDKNQAPYLEALNDQQRAAVCYTDGPSLVIAGAGSGKTRVLTYKIVDLLAKGFHPGRILALTFTNKAAREMKERVAAEVGPETAARLWMGTFHSIFLRLLYRHADLLGFKSNFTIYDTSDSRSLVKMIIRDLGLDDKLYKPASIAAAISSAKNSLISPADYLADPDFQKADKDAGRPLMGEIYRIYCTRCKLADAMDFDDILLFTYRLLKDRPDVRLHYQEFFQYILVDEYQDTNFVQHEIIKLLANSEQRICVVGDDAQSIYSFRGANIGNILSLKANFPTLQEFKLERNYRSTRNIVKAAGSLIRKNARQIPKNVYSENATGAPIDIIESYSDFEEGYLVASLINRSKLECHDSYEDYAILYRTNAQSRVLEEALRKRNIPYRIYGGLAFYQRKEVKDALSYFRMAVNPDDDEALRRIINFPARGIGDTTMGKLQAAAIGKGVSIWQVISHPEDFDLSINAGTQKKLAAFKELIDTFIADVEHGSNAFETGQLIFNRTGLLTMLMHDQTPEAISRQENLTQVQSALQDFIDEKMNDPEAEDLSMRAFLSEVSLATDQDESDSQEGDKVTLMTVHASKGLEFKHVYIVGLEEDLFPSNLALMEPYGLEEERRLLYVAITRACETCTITYANSRFRNGATTVSNPSRFLSEIDPSTLRIKTFDALPPRPQFTNPVANYRRNEARVQYKPQPKQTAAPKRYDRPAATPAASLSPVSSAGNSGSVLAGVHSIEEVKVGMKIRHSTFGDGTIVEIEANSDPKIAVQFDKKGLKKLLLRFAKFEIKD